MPSKNSWVWWFDLTCELFFLADMLSMFFQQYKDKEKLRVVKDLNKIMIHYFKTSFFWHTIAIIPWNLFLDPTKKATQFLRGFKLLRMGRMQVFLQEDRFKELLNKI